MSEKVVGEVLSTKRLFNGIVFNVDEFKIGLTHHTKSGCAGQVMEVTRQLVTKRPCVVALVKHRGNDKFLLVKEFRIGAMCEEFGLVAGIVDAGETTWDAVIRELREEVGYKPKLVQQIGESFSSSGFTNEHITYFYIEVEEEGRVEQSLDSDEIIIVRDVKFNELTNMIKWGEIKGNHAKACVLHFMLSNMT